MRCQAQPKGLIEGIERLFDSLGRWAIEYARKHVGHSTFGNSHEVDCLELEGLGEEVHVPWYPVLLTSEVVASFVDGVDLFRRQLPALDILMM